MDIEKMTDQEILKKLDPGSIKKSLIAEATPFSPQHCGRILRGEAKNPDSIAAVIKAIRKYYNLSALLNRNKAA